MIYTLTFSPTIDYVIHLNGEFEAGRINRTSSESVYYGGKGVNVSQVLMNLGVRNTALGFVAGFTGDEIEKGLNALGCKTEFVHLREGRSRINIKIMADVESEINATGPRIDDASIDKLFEIIGRMTKEDVLVVAGAVPSSMPDYFFPAFIEKVYDSGVNVVADVEGSMLSNILPYHPFLIKPNHIELSTLFGDNYLPTETDRITEAARQLQAMGARNVLVSLGEEGAILVSESGKVYRRTAPSGMVRNTVGSGDSMVAGFIAGYMDSYDYDDAFAMAIAAGSATAFMDGLAGGEEIRELYRLIR